MVLLLLLLFCLSALSRTVMMILPLPHYGNNFVTNFFGGGKMCRNPPPPQANTLAPPLLHIFLRWRDVPHTKEEKKNSFSKPVGYRRFAKPKFRECVGPIVHWVLGALTFIAYRGWGTLKEKLPQAFMQIGWMENDFRNLSAKVCANLDNPIKSYDFAKFWLISCMPLSQVALC